MSESIATGGQETELMLGPIFGGSKDTYHVDAQTREARGTEVALQSIDVQLPEEPMLINGLPYEFSVDGPRLAGALNILRLKSAAKGTHEPRALEITLGESLPPSVIDTKETATALIYKTPGNKFGIEVPKEIAKSESAQSVLIDKVENAVNRDLKLGILESLARNADDRRFARFMKSFLIGGVILGEGVGIALVSDGSIVEYLKAGILGSVAGLGAGTGATLATEYVWGDHDNRIRRRAQKLSHSPNLSELHKHFKEPIISLTSGSEN